MEEMKSMSSNMFAVIQGVQDPTDALPMPDKCIRYVIKNESNSTANMYVGLGVPGSAAMILQPGESYASPVVKGMYNYDKIYVAWEPGMNGGKGLCIQTIDLQKEVCN